jgi:hypothetical protein
VSTEPLAILHELFHDFPDDYKSAYFEQLSKQGELKNTINEYNKMPQVKAQFILL